MLSVIASTLGDSAGGMDESGACGAFARFGHRKGSMAARAPYALRLKFASHTPKPG
jgi:hypothetical protein